jgi:hypothetical protein
MSKISYAIIATALMLASGSTGAMAGGKHFKHHGFGNNFHSFHHSHNRHHRPIIQLSIGGGGCGYYYENWMDTGSRYWKRKYYLCKGWW